MRYPPWQGYLDYSGGNWQHGWHPTEHNVHPELVVGYDGLSFNFREKNRFYVARPDQKEFLQKYGYKNVHSIGLPIAYLPKPVVSRIPNSLLVMPSHSLDSTSHSWSFEGLKNTIAEIKKKYDVVYACLHPSCIKKGYWLREFDELGISVIQGASAGDANALLRISILFSLFTNIVGNGFGSHLAYAPFFGAQPMLVGPWAAYKLKDFENDMFYKNRPDVAREVVKLSSEDSVREHHTHLFTHDTTDLQSWATKEIGYDNLRTPSDIKRLVGWTLSDRLRCSIRYRLVKSMKKYSCIRCFVW